MNYEALKLGNASFETCVLCNRKLKDTSVPLGTECRKKLKKTYRVAILNMGTGCYEAPNVYYRESDLVDYFGGGVDLFLLVDTGSHWGMTIFDGQSFGWFSLDGVEDSDGDLSDQIQGNKAFAVGWMIDKGHFEHEVVHTDSNILRPITHSTYLGPAKNLDEVKARWAAEGVTPSCGCGMAAEAISDREAFYEDEIDKWAVGETALHEIIRGQAEQALSSVEKYWSDITELSSEEGWDTPLTEWLWSDLSFV